MAAGATGHMLEPLLAGMREAGAETEMLQVRRLNLEPCLGCYTCWVQTPGRCIHDDGMAPALESYGRANLVVFGTPVYHGTMTGLLKTFLDRLLPRYEPWLVPHETWRGRSGHPVRGSEPPAMLLVSPCGFPERENFDVLVYTFRHIARMHGARFAGAILRPFAEPLRLRGLQGLFEGYYAALSRAGGEIVRRGAISVRTQKELDRDLLPGNDHQKREMANEHWRLQLEDRAHHQVHAREEERAP
jgi:hypothetical protein